MVFFIRKTFDLPTVGILWLRLDKLSNIEIVLYYYYLFIKYTYMYILVYIYIYTHIYTYNINIYISRHVAIIYFYAIKMIKTKK